MWPIHLNCFSHSRSCFGFLFHVILSLILLLYFSLCTHERSQIGEHWKHRPHSFSDAVRPVLCGWLITSGYFVMRDIFIQRTFNIWPLALWQPAKDLIVEKQMLFIRPTLIAHPNTLCLIHPHCKHKTMHASYALLKITTLKKWK